MDIFNSYNAGAVAKRSIYKKNTELPLFVPMKLKEIKPTTTVNGPTHQVSVYFLNQEIFFFLNNADHNRILALNACDQLMSLISSGQNPFAVNIKRRTGLSTLFLPFCKLVIFSNCLYYLFLFVFKYSVFFFSY